MVALPNPTVDAIYAAYERDNEPWLRQHIGGSDIGRQCDRRIWLTFRWAQTSEKIGGRILRLFKTGHREEARLIDDLRNAGVQVWDRDEKTGKQIEYTGLDGHLVVHLDAVVLDLPERPNVPHLLEVKTSNKKNFDKLEGVNSKGEVDPTKRGVEKNKPEHFQQMQLCMGLAGLTRALYLVTCKDDERIYAERVRFDDKVFKALLLRAQRIIKTQSAPDRINKDPSFYVCKFCPLTDLCHGTQMPEKNCRTCIHSEPGPGGTWACNNGRDMKPGCAEHVFLPDLFSAWADPVDGTPEWIKYKVRSTSRHFVNTAASGFPAQDAATYESAELVNCKPAMLGDPSVEAVREKLDGRVESTVDHTAGDNDPMRMLDDAGLFHP